KNLIVKQENINFGILTDIIWCALMDLDENIYNALVEIIGERFVSKDKVITEAYSFNWFNDVITIRENRESSNFLNAPLAVALPGTTEEVIKIVKLIHEVGLKFKAQSTGLGGWNCPLTDDVIILDMRRMNEIRKIDKKNMFAVIEPYVTGATLQAELLKHDLNTHMPGAGPQVSPLASSTSMCGPGFTGDVTGYSARNVLGVEWVLPNGELLKLGSLGLDGDPDWYCADGPGFSLRGVMRGAQGVRGGLGVFTACAVKLYPFPCEPKWNLSGVSPNYEFDIPNYMEFHFINYKNWELAERALNRSSEEEIGFMVCYISNFAAFALFSRDRADLAKKAASIGRLKKPLCVLLCGRTKREIEYKRKVLDHLIEETGGRDFTTSGKFVPRSQSYVEALRSMLGIHAFLATGSFESTFGGMDSLTLAFRMAKENVVLKKEFIEKHSLPDDQGQSGWIQTYEYGHYAHSEMPTMYDINDLSSRQGMFEYYEKSEDVCLNKSLNFPFFIDGDKLHEKWGEKTCNYHVWLRKIKEAFDPQNTADSSFYISTTSELARRSG
ncbi:MAG: FAD-binding oxidoreductase, partial [Candidatus Helarchaeota archaeon]